MWPSIEYISNEELDDKIDETSSYLDKLVAERQRRTRPTDHDGSSEVTE